MNKHQLLTNDYIYHVRIIIIGPAYPYRGGIADTNESLCRALISEGHQASITTFTVQYPSFLFPGKSQYSDGPAPEGLDIERLIHSFNPITWSSSVKQILASDPDLVIFRFWTPFIGLVYRTLAKRLKAKTRVIALVDNASPHEGSLMDKRLTRSFLSHVEGVMCLSEYVAKELAPLVNVPVTSSPHPINTDLEPKIDRAEALKILGLEPDIKYMLFFGLIRKYKGLDLLLQSLKLLKGKVPQLKLIIAGEFYDAKAPYLKYITEHGLEELVVMHDAFVPKDKISAYFSVAEMLTLTYRTATQSGVTQMAIHYDLPMLVTDVGALKEYVAHDQMGYVLAKDPQIIADSIQDFFEADRFQEMSKAVAEKKDMYNWEHFAKALMRLTEDLSYKAVH